MIVVCEKCSKKYKIDPGKIPGDRARFKCLECEHINIVKKPVPEDEQWVDDLVMEMSDSVSETAEETESEGPRELHLRRGISFGLRSKMIVFFIIIPVMLMAMVSVFYMYRMESLSDLLTGESSDMVTKMAETIIAEKARFVARETRLYLETHPNLRKEQFFENQAFKSIAIQKVGKTGYTCLVETPTPGQPIHRLWCHPLKKLIGIDIDKAMKKTLGKDFKRWYDITARAYKGKGQEAAGYYMWYDKREKYMVMTPVEGTNFFIASTTYLDEFTVPVKDLQQQANQMTGTTVRSVIIFLILATLIIAAISLFYANRISGNIRHLTDIADRISVGELDLDVRLASKDELGVLANAISRMQESIRISIERLRRKR